MIGDGSIRMNHTITETEDNTAVARDTAYIKQVDSNTLIRTNTKQLAGANQTDEEFKN